MVVETGEEFYAEFTDYDKTQVTEWISDNVIKRLELKGDGVSQSGTTVKIKGDKLFVAGELKNWLTKFEAIEVWADVLAYDWVLFCELFGGALGLPVNIFFTPFDLSTLFRVKGLIKPIGQYQEDISRFEFVGVNKERQHNALADARVEMECFYKLNVL